LGASLLLVRCYDLDAYPIWLYILLMKYKADLHSDPYFYILVDAFSKDVQFEKIVSKKSFHIAKLSSGHKSTNRVIVFETSHGELSNLVRIEHSALGTCSFPS